MKLWLLRPKPNSQASPWIPWYDKAFGFVVRAENEETARNLASYDCGGEGKEAWLNPRYSTCEELTAEGIEGTIIQDFASA